ncbi:MAG TPA: PAS domain S-box protein [Phycisphaerae bacterium]|nr:PAS domain S-box protein [Phycisphaerae bacterium]HRW51676.1 PAS domain S-box protein [Phycisphaerae bacterium]
MAIEVGIPDAVLWRAIDALDSPVVLVNASGRIDLANRAWRRLAEASGICSNTLAGDCDIIDACVRIGAISRDDAPTHAQHLRRVLTGGPVPSPGDTEANPGETAIRIQRLDHGGAIWALVTLDAPPGPAAIRPPLNAETHSSPPIIAPTIHDTIRACEGRLGEVQRIAHVGHWDRQLPAGAPHWSAEIYRILGLSPDRSSPSLETFMRLIHPDDLPLVRAQVKRAFDRHENFSIVTRIIRPDGVIRYVLDSAEFDFDASGRPSRLFGVLHDITELKLAEIQLRDQAATHSIRARLRDADPNQSEADAWRMLIDAMVREFELSGGLFAEWSDVGFRRLCAVGRVDDAPETERAPDTLDTTRGAGRMLQAAMSHRRPFHSVRLDEGATIDRVAPRLAVPVELDGRIIGGALFQADSIDRFSDERAREFHDLVNEMGERIWRHRIEHEAAQSIRRSEERLLKAMAEAPVLMIALDERGAIIAWNSECERVTGYRADEIIGRPDAIDRLYPDTERRRAFLENWVHGLQDFRDWELDTTCRDGGVRTIAWSRVSSRVAISGWAHWGIGIDTTERHNAESALAKSEREYRGLFDNAHDAIMIFRPDDEVILEANPHACRLYGMSRSEFIGMSLKDISEDVERGQRRISETMVLGKNAGFETVQYRKNGAAMRLEINATVIDYRGERAILTINRDITSRRSAEDGLRSSEARYRWFADHSTDLILRMSNDGVIQDASHASRAILGVAPDALVGVQCADLVTPKYRDALNETIRKAVRKPGSHRVTLHFHRDDQSERWLECLIEGLRSADDSMVREIVAVARDMSVRKQEEELRELRFMELSHVSRLVTLGEMAGQIAHQLHQPLTAIANYAGTLRNLIRKCDAGSSMELEPYCDEIIRSAIRTGEFIHRIRTFTQRRGLRRSSVHLSTLVSNAFSLCEIRLQRLGVHTSYCEATDLPDIVVDSIQIEQVLVNLINNAIDAMSTRDPGQRRLGVTGHVETPNELRVCVRDSGVGLPDDGQRNLFQPFHTTKPDGVGMGLVISRRIVEAHGGRLWIKSQPNGGTSVYFTLAIGDHYDPDD